LTENRPKDLILMQRKLKELDNSTFICTKNEKEESEEEELKLQTVENTKTPKKAQINEAHKKLNPLSSAKYQNNVLNSNRSKTKSPFRTNSEETTQEKYVSNNKTPKENNNIAKNQNILQLNFNNKGGDGADLMKKTPVKNQLYEKIFQRAQELDLEEKLKHEEVKKKKAS